MKKILLTAALGITMSSVWAQKPYGSAGCGLGSLLMGRDGSQVLAATTNATSYSQTFGITSGTSNCVDQTRSASFRLPIFIDGNQVALTNDISRGSGETIVHLAAILNCEDANILGNGLKNHFNEIVPSTSLKSDEMSRNILNLIERDNTLASVCRPII